MGIASGALRFRQQLEPGVFHAQFCTENAIHCSSREAWRCANQLLIILKPSLTRWEHLPLTLDAKRNQIFNQSRHMKSPICVSRPIDLTQFEHQTFHDPDLAIELLAMFKVQIPPLLQALSGTEGRARSEIAHRLKGSALAMAANVLAKVAEELEANPDHPATLAKLEHACADVLQDIDLHLQSGIKTQRV
jgi:HPt (histidine-containing phosphotransfer) domain-containing protein